MLVFLLKKCKNSLSYSPPPPPPHLPVSLCLRHTHPPPRNRIHYQEPTALCLEGAHRRVPACITMFLSPEISTAGNQHSGVISNSVLFSKTASALKVCVRRRQVSFDLSVTLTPRSPPAFLLARFPPPARSGQCYVMLSRKIKYFPASQIVSSGSLFIRRRNTKERKCCR